MVSCVHCGVWIDGKAKWCCMEHKKQFLIDNYSPEATIRAMRETQEDFRKGQKEVMKKIKESGLGISEYILGLGAFNDANVLEDER